MYLQGSDKDCYNFNVGATPYLDGNIAYVGTNKNGLVAVNMDSLEVMWECQTGYNMIYASAYSGKGSKGVEASVVVKDDKLYFGGMDRMLYVVDKTTGVILGEFNIGSPILSKAVVGSANNRDFIIVSDFEGRVTKINLLADGTFSKSI